MENKELIEAMEKKIWQYYNLTEEQYEDIIKPWKEVIFEIVRQDAGKVLVETVENMKLGEAIKVLQKHLREDKSEGSYYYSWQANIAMAFKDECGRYYGEGCENDGKYLEVSDIHTIANQAAKNFLDLLIKE